MSTILSLIPWAILFLVFAGMAALLWRALSALDDLAKLLAQLLGQASPKTIAVPPVALPPLPSPPPVPQVVVPAAPAKPPAVLSSKPDWQAWAEGEIGFHETGNNQGIEKYIALAHCGALGDPWCAIFMNAALEATGHPGTRSPSSQSFLSHPNFVALAGPAPGAIVVFWRIARGSGQGHVGIYLYEDDTRIWTLGGNENDMVQIEALPKESASFGLIGYCWPKGAALPGVGAVRAPIGAAMSIKTSPSPASSQGPGLAPLAKQTSIVATVFGGEQSAYGGAIDDAGLGVALPFRFAGPRPQVLVSNPKTGVSITADIVDVGPWNTNDPYWQAGTRPEAETGVDTRGRKTNKAGIDLTIAAAKALQIDGKGLVDWEFLQSPTSATPQPNVV